MSKAKKTTERYRDARTGHYVTPEYAREHPDTTVKETEVTKVPKVPEVKEVPLMPDQD